MRRLSLVLLGLLFGAAACSGSTSVETAVPETDGQAVATAPANGESGDETATTGEAAERESAAQATTVSFESEIMPIMEGVCARCHAPGAPGSTHWELATAVDAVTFANSIHAVTQDGYMPPWPASDLSLNFSDDYSLSAQEIDAIDRWAEEGGGIDVNPATPITSSVPLRVMDNPDRVVTSANGAYKGSTDTADDYRCLIFDPEFTEPGWVLGTHFEPDQVEVVHHVIGKRVSGNLRDEAEWWDSLDDGPGWTCYGGVGFNTENGGYIRGAGGWVPGASYAPGVPGYATPVNAGDFYVLQIHYHYDTNDAPADLSRYLVDLASPEEIAAVGGQYKQTRGQTLLGPAEIPCALGDTNPLCDRALALERVTDLYGTFGHNLAEGLTRGCGFSPEDYAHMTSGEAWSTCDIRSQNSGQLIGVFGHMHELGKSIRITLHPDTPDEVILLDIPDWDFDWQIGYRVDQDITIEKGDIFRLDCSWGRDRAPYEPDGYVLWSEGTGDEMCFATVRVIPPE